jgi:hypothetical protein
MENGTPLLSLERYARFVADLLHRPEVERSTLTVWSTSPYTGVAEGEVFFIGGFRLRVREELDFNAGLITAYGYEIYRGDQRLCWWDDFPHPEDKDLAATFPHHKHIPPDIKRHRVPAPEMSYTRPNLPVLIQEVLNLLRMEIVS